MAEYHRRRSSHESPTVDPFSPMKESPSPRSNLRISTERGGKRLMSEDEVSSLVHSALQRARQATSSFSPRARSARSPQSQHSSAYTSPTSSLRAVASGQSPSFSNRPPAPLPTTARKNNTGLYVPSDDEIHHQPSLSKRSTRTKYCTPRGEEEPGFSFGDFLTPEQSGAEESHVVVDLNDYMTSDGEGSDENLFGPSLTSVNSSEEIIRRVEEEIANARKAAQEANQRLAGVSANLKDNHIHNFTSSASAETTSMEPIMEPIETSEQKDTATFNESSECPPALSHNDEEGDPFDFAMDVIGEEFDVSKSVDCTISTDVLDKVSMDVEELHELDIDTSLEPSSSKPKLCSPEAPEDESQLEKEEYEETSPKNPVGKENEGIILSPSEEIDSLLNSESAEFPIEDKNEFSGMERKRTIPIAIDHYIEEAPSEEITTLKTESNAENASRNNPSQPSTLDELTEEKVDTESQKEHTGDEDCLEWIPLNSQDNKSTEVVPDLEVSLNEEVPAEEIEKNAVNKIEPTEATGTESEVPDQTIESDTKSSKNGIEESCESRTCDEDQPDDENMQDYITFSTNKDQPDTNLTENTLIDREGEDHDYGSIESKVDGGVEEQKKNDEGDHQAEVFIYQVVSVGSADAVATSNAASPQESAQSAQTQDNISTEEAIEIMPEPIESAEGQEGTSDCIQMMNTRDPIESAVSQEGTSDCIRTKNTRDLPKKIEEIDKEPKICETSDLQDDLKEIKIEAEAEEARVNSKEELLNEDSDPNCHETGSTLDDGEISETTQPVNNTEEEEYENEENKTIFDDQVTQIMSNTSDQKHEVIETATQAEESTKAPTVDRQLELVSNVSPRSIEVLAATSPRRASLTAPSSRRVSLVENRRARQSRVEEACMAMCGKSGVPVGLPNPTKEIVNKPKKVKFKQRYPVPPPIKKPLNPAEIIMNNKTKAPNAQLRSSKPKKDLQELLEAVKGGSIQRRSNACGALKVLSTQKKNNMTLVGTEGFLDALVFAVSDNVSAHEDTEAAVAARTRAINVVLNVCEIKENRYHVFSHPGLAYSLLKCIEEDREEARAIACATLATLAKSAVCRESISNTPRLIEVLSIILMGQEPLTFNKDKQQNKQPHLEEEKKDYSADGDDEASRGPLSDSYTCNSSEGNSSGSRGSMASQEKAVHDRARMNACAALMHLSKECSVSEKMCANPTILFCLVATSNDFDSPLHAKSLEILANLTRFPHNNAIMATYPGLVQTLLANGNHADDTDRLWSMRTLQNLSSDSSAKTILATKDLLELLSVNIMRQKYEEQYAATAALYNISTEPGAVVPLTNTKNVVATLVHVAHNPISPGDVRLMACDTLATLGLWLQTLAGAGTIPQGYDPNPLPTYVTAGWKRWD